MTVNNTQLKSSIAEKTRIQVELSPTELERMSFVMHVCEIGTRRDLFNNALTLFDWVVNEVIKGRKIASFDDQSSDRMILSMPVLNTAANHRFDYVEDNEASDEEAIPSMMQTS